MKRWLCTIFALMLAFTHAGAQFYSSGDDPGGVRWRSISSDHFRIIYPAGSDSLALRYGLELERWNLPLAASSGYSPNGMYRRPLPVILHSYTAAANGAVTWAPRRMDLFTCPDATSPEPLPWITGLAVHESRHASQMQFNRGRGFGLFNAVTGELFAGALAGLYPGPALLEGDAVATETALTRSGRGRSADFLEQYRVSFAEGDFRDFYRWRWGSQKLYTPDHYRAGYMLVAGMRYVYDDPFFTRRYFDNILSSPAPLPFFVLQRTIKQVSGKNLKGTWLEIAGAQQALWAADEAARGPFGSPRQLTPSPRRYTEYLSPEAVGGDVYAIRKGITSAPELVRVLQSGKSVSVRPMSNTAEQIRYSAAAERLFWSETVPDPRWTLKSSSRIFYLEPGGGRARMLTREGNLFNPSPAPDGTALAVTEYQLHGGTAVRILDGLTGATLERYPAPDSLQVVETAWAGGTLVASAISESGAGFYDVKDGYRQITAPAPSLIKQLRPSAGGILFVSDRVGVNELYRLDEAGRTIRLTNHRFGASEFLPDASGDSLTFAAPSAGGRLLYREAMSDHVPSSLVVTGAPAVFIDRLPDGGVWPVADRLSQQEAVLSAVPLSREEGIFSAPRPYRKLTHLLRLHSWAPLYINYDAIANTSFETLASTAGLGATAFMQNDLGTASAIVGYSATPTVSGGITSWDHTLHGKFIYRGLYPVIELSADLGGREAKQYRIRTVTNDQASRSVLEGSDTGVKHFLASARIYVPLDFSRAGWRRGLVPTVSAYVSNDMMDTRDILQKLVMVLGDNPGLYRFSAGLAPGHDVPLSRVTASLRGYTMLGTARSAIYPRWGIGAEAGASLRPGVTDVLAPSAYGYLYGYVPGLMDTHGIRLSALYQRKLGGRFPDNAVTVLPRGMTTVKGLYSYIQSNYASQTRLTFDYAMPILPLDWSGLGPVAYVRNFELTLHADGCLLGGGENVAGTGASGPGDILYSAGADLAVRLGNLLWIPAATRIGVSFNYNGCTISGALSSAEISIPATRFGLILSVDLP